MSQFTYESCQKYVVLRTSNEDSLNALKSLGYEFSEPFETSPENVHIWKLPSKESAQQLIHDSQLEKLGISANLLVGLNGIRLREANDFLKSLSSTFEHDNHHLISFLVELICVEAPEKGVLAKEELKMIRDEISKFIENPVCTIFGSYPSKVRRNGFSDIDLAVSTMPTDSMKIRTFQTVVDDVQYLLEQPINHAEFYSWPDSEVVKAMYNCFRNNEEFCKRFQMRAHLVETPIVMLKSTNIPDLDMSYDISVNNQISIEKAQLLNDFIVADESRGNKMREVVMFVVHWAKSNKLLGGAYPDEKLIIKYKFNSYIINYLIIHFVQIAGKTCIINALEKPESRVSNYNFDEIFPSYTEFLKQFFEYYLSFDYEKMGIFGTELIEKELLADSKGVKVSPFMMVDSLHTTHNFTGNVTPDGVQFFKTLLTSSLEKMKDPNFRISDLL